VSGFNTNWDADWGVRAGITARGWEAEFSIPLKTLRYKSGHNQTWGVNAMRIIRRCNEHVYLAPVPRGQHAAGGIERLPADPAGHDVGRFFRRVSQGGEAVHLLVAERGR